MSRARITRNLQSMYAANGRTQLYSLTGWLYNGNTVADILRATGWSRTVLVAHIALISADIAALKRALS